MSTTKWEPLSLLLENSDDSFAIIKLNSDFCDDFDETLFTRLWKRAKLRAATDGAANILYKRVPASHSEYLPSFISGDLDSITTDVKNFFLSKGVQVIETPDQDYTDFTKCLKLAVEKIKLNGFQIKSMVAHVGVFHSRLDHTLANINTLFVSWQLTNIPLFLIMGESISCLLKEGKHELHGTTSMRGKWCSLIPVGKPCQHVTTTGLKYNLCDQPMQFGDLISTSNEFEFVDHPIVTVDTDGPLLWSMEIKF